MRLLRNWPGNSDPCGCGCGMVGYGRSDPANWWQSLTPKLLWETRLLLPQWRCLYSALWAFCSLLWKITLGILGRKGFRALLITNPLHNKLGTIMTPVRAVAWLIVVLSLGMAALFVGVVVIPLLYVVSLALLASVLLLVWFLATVYIASHGLVFLIGGVSSILYLSNPAVGIVLIALGLGIEYESKRRRDRNHREEVGQLLRVIEGARTPTDGRNSNAG